MMAVCRMKWAIFDSETKKQETKNARKKGNKEEEGRKQLLQKVSGSVPALTTVDEWPIKIFYSFARRDSQHTHLPPLSRKAMISGHAFFFVSFPHSLTLSASDSRNHFVA